MYVAHLDLHVLTLSSPTRRSSYLPAGIPLAVQAVVRSGPALRLRCRRRAADRRPRPPAAGRRCRRVAADSRRRPPPVARRGPRDSQPPPLPPQLRPGHSAPLPPPPPPPPSRPAHSWPPTPRRTGR